MTKDCWICREKAAWKQDKIDKARAEARQLAASGEWMVIVQIGCQYKVKKLSEIGSEEVFEYVV